MQKLNKVDREGQSLENTLLDGPTPIISPTVSAKSGINLNQLNVKSSKSLIQNKPSRPTLELKAEVFGNPQYVILDNSKEEIMNDEAHSDFKQLLGLGNRQFGEIYLEKVEKLKSDENEFNRTSVHKRYANFKGRKNSGPNRIKIVGKLNHPYHKPYIK